VTLPVSKPEPVIAEPVGIIVEPDRNHSLSPAPGAIVDATPVTNESAKPAVPVSPVPVGAHATTEPHADVGETPIADAKSDSGSTAVADPELTEITPSVPSTSPNASEHKGKPPALPSTPTKAVDFPSVSPPSSPSLFNSLRGSGRKPRKRSFLAKLKDKIFKSDKDKDKERAETKT